MNRLLLTMVVLAAMTASALEMGAPFTDGAVLQRGRKVPVWGTAAAGEKVTVEFAGQSVSAVAGADGSWRVDLAPMEASAESRDMTVRGGTTSVSSAMVNESADQRGRDGARPSQSEQNQVIIHDILVGEVWFASGQSNMQCPIWSGGSRYRDGKGAMMLAMVNQPQIRFVKCKCVWSVKPLAGEPAQWHRFVKDGFSGAELSAVAFYYARELYLALGVPIGIVDASWGGTVIDAWTPRSAYATCDESLRAFAEYQVHEDWVSPRDEYLSIDGKVQQPTVLWNGMVDRFAPMAMRGMIWYQGCQDWREPHLYTAKMHNLYKGWSQEFENPDLSFYFVQLAPWKAKHITDNWCAMAAAQNRFVAEEKHAAIAVVSDWGNPDDIHPNTKEVVAQRLALHALKRDYGFDIKEDDSPVFKSAEFREDGSVALDFDHVKRWYVYARNRSHDPDFQVAGADGVWHPAKVLNWETTRKKDRQTGEEKTVETENISGSVIVIRSDAVAKPVKARYLVTPGELGTMFSWTSLPLGPFETQRTVRVGPMADPAADATPALQAAIDDCFRAGGGCVRVAAGEYQVKSLRLRSNITFYLERGAKLRASRNPADYDGVVLDDRVEPYGASAERRGIASGSPRLPADEGYLVRSCTNHWNNGILRIFRAHDVAIIGESGSEIDGRNCYDPKGEETYRGPHGISAHFVTNLLCRGYTIRNTGNWSHRIALGANIRIEGVTVLGGHDGLDFHSCSNSFVTGCDIRSGDDSIAGFDIDGLTVRCSRLNSSCSIFRVGGRNILGENLEIVGPGEYPHRSRRLDRQQLIDGVTLEKYRDPYTLSFFTFYGSKHTQLKPGNIVFRNCRINRIMRFMHYNFSGNERWQTGAPLRDVTFENIVATDIEHPLAVYAGEGSDHVIRFRNCSISFNRGSFPEGPEAFIRGANIKAIEAEGLKIEGLKCPFFMNWQGETELKLKGLEGLEPTVVPGKDKFVAGPI